MERVTFLHRVDDEVSSPRDDFLDFRVQLLESIMAVAVLFALLFALLHSAGINDIGDFLAAVDYLYAGTSLLLIFWLRNSRVVYRPALNIFLFLSFVTFLSALINVPIDQFRAIWFYLLVVASYFLGGSQTGVVVTAASITVIALVERTIGLEQNSASVVTTLLGLVVLGIIVHLYADRVSCFVALLEDKNRELESLASRDPLTDIMNARAYYEVGTTLTEIALRERSPLTLLYIDIDHFKQINDRFGHHAGDQVLQQVATTITDKLRDSDILARIGGEEFSVILPLTDRLGGEVLAEKVRYAIESATTSIDGSELTVTASIGVAELAPGERTIQQLQRRADTALYRAKSEGRNRVAIAPWTRRSGELYIVKNT